MTVEPIQIPAPDGYMLHGFARTQPGSRTPERPVVIINNATAVKCQYYDRFADALFAQGSDVLTYDYRGIGISRYGSLRSLSAGWLHWGQCDFEAMLQYANRHYPGQPIHVVGHSVGGVLIGMAPSSPLIARIFTMGAQYAYWPDYAQASRMRMRLQWHWLMPTLARLMGYVPAKRLGWMEDTPKGVALDWSGMGPRIEQSIRQRGPGTHADPARLLAGFSVVRAPILAVSAEDDPFGTTAAIHRLLDYYTGCERQHLRLAPEQVDENGIGHFAFFHSRFKDSLWPIAFKWLLQPRVPIQAPGALSRFGDGQASGCKDANRPQHGPKTAAPTI